LTTTEETAQTVTVVVEPLPFFFGDQSTGSLWIWIFQTVMQHSETPLTPKTLDFVDQAFLTSPYDSEHLFLGQVDFPDGVILGVT
jgi:hypothetical protein